MILVVTALASCGWWINTSQYLRSVGVLSCHWCIFYVIDWENIFWSCSTKDCLWYWYISLSQSPQLSPTSTLLSTFHGYHLMLHLFITHSPRRKMLLVHLDQYGKFLQTQTLTLDLASPLSPMAGRVTVYGWDEAGFLPSQYYTAYSESPLTTSSPENLTQRYGCCAILVMHA